MDTVYVNYSSQPMTRRQIATATAMHISGVVNALGPERAHTVLSSWLNWPLESLQRIATLNDINTLIHHLENTRFANITTLRTS